MIKQSQQTACFPTYSDERHRPASFLAAMRRLQPALAVVAATAVLMLAPSALALSASEEIEHLLKIIAGSSCTFIRNDVEYSGAEAAAHVRDKYEHFKGDIESAEDFIALAASKSMLSGRPYLVRCAGEPVQPAAQWLSDALAAFRAQ